MSWTKIEEVTLSSSAASVTLGNGGTIPQTYKTLKLVISARGTAAGDAGAVGITITFNASSSNFSFRWLYGTGTTVGSVSGSSNSLGVMGGSGVTANTFSSREITIPNYNSSTNKPFSIDYVTETNATNAEQAMMAQLWSNTSAITSIGLVAPTGDFSANSTFTLYGLK